MAETKTERKPKAEVKVRPKREVRGHPSTSAGRRFAKGERGPAVPDTSPRHVARDWADEEPGDGGQGDNGTGRDLGPRTIKLDMPKPFRSTSRVLVVEFVACLALIALKPKEPATPGKASESIVPQIAGIMVVFLLLAMVGASGPRAQRISNLFGGLVAVVLAFHNHANVVSAVASVTSYQTPATPTGAPSATAPPAPGSAGDILPTPTGQPTGLAQQIVSGWRGAAVTVPTPSGRLTPVEQIVSGT